MASNQTSIRAVFGALFLALWLAALDQTVVSTALPTMVADLGGLSYLSWVVTAYLLTSTVAVALDAPPPRDRLCRRAPAHRRAQCHHPVHGAWRHDISLDLAGHARLARGGRRRNPRLRRRRAALTRADPADEPVRQPQFRGRERRRFHRRAFAVRRGDVPSHLSSDCPRGEPIDLRRAADADDARH